MTTRRIISSDSHVSVQHDDVKAHLASRFHDDYDAALAQAYREMLGGNAAKANAGRRRDPARLVGPARATPTRTSGCATWTPTASTSRSSTARSSAYRYLYLLEHGAAEATRAFNDTLHDFASADPSRLSSPTRCRSTTSTSRSPRSSASRSMGGKSLQLPVFPAELGQPDYFHERYDRMWAAISASGLPMCCHIGLNTALNSLADRDPTPRLAWTLSCMPPSACEALGMWLLTGIFTRYPELKVVFVEPGLGWVAGYLSFLDDMVLRQGYEFPVLGERAAELLLPPQHGDDVHRRARSGAPPAPRARRART